MAAWIKMPLRMELRLSPGDFVLDGDPALPSPKLGQSSPPQFSAHFYCGQTAGCITMPLGMEIGLSPGDFVLDGDPAPFQKGGGARGRSPQFSAHVYCGQTAGWIKMALAMDFGGRPWSTPHCARWGHSSPSPKGAQPPPNFRPISVAAKWLHGSRCHLV